MDGLGVDWKRVDLYGKMGVSKVDTYILYKSVRQVGCDSDQFYEAMEDRSEERRVGKEC